jgi:homoserine O-acetyltransferase
MLGGCYGSTGPLSIDPKSSNPFYHTFPVITNRDVVKAFDLLRIHLSIEKIHTLIGGSLGGQQTLEWAIAQPDVFENIVPMACNAWHSPWGIAFNEAQRLAIEADPTWKESDARAGAEGLKAARAIGMISYRHYDTFLKTQSEKTADKLDDYRAASYQKYQGQKLANRFNAFTYWILTKIMDSHHVGRGKKNTDGALKKIKARTLVVGIDSDILFPIAEQEYLAQQIPNARLESITSLYGHDGFLVEFEQLNTILNKFYKEKISILS